MHASTYVRLLNISSSSSTYVSAYCTMYGAAQALLDKGGQGKKERVVNYLPEL